MIEKLRDRYLSMYDGIREFYALHRTSPNWKDFKSESGMRLRQKIKMTLQVVAIVLESVRYYTRLPDHALDVII